MKTKLILLFLIFFSSQSCSEERIIPDEMDIHNQDTRQLFNVDVSLLELIKPGETTELELYQILGRKIMERFTFSPILPYQYRKKYVPIDRFIRYEGYKGTIIKTQEYTISKANTVPLVKFYLYKGSIQFYSIIDWDKESDIVTELSTVDAMETTLKEITKNSNMSIWGYERCTSKYFQIKMLHYDTKPNRTTNAHKEVCYWEESDFEKKLAKNKEYQDFLNDPHYGKKLLEMGYIPPVANWKGK
ncbi:hypothetical protein EHQ16_18460 [Leptospira kanakyensis]|uniref:Lipoprotein n=1 Tax=Leptospira kanakyensis TaxID=2484968 RepID=A0A6N4Q4T7_9LEPT|nr:hypothetical protein [Leptospira kanakyensis]TGK54013.1 hypothetical protein EHQ11_06770 [Leptospira kanakyensis]TGK57808.1 hypothetical protein EHQ16_18460 [Leptospira kanakyensis]TGK73517.1 hypothetical protein EHQ18_06845 [Leptospira kanakyensis]